MAYELLNSDAEEEEFGIADVYYSSEISLNRNRTPGTWVRNDKNNARKGKEQVGKAKWG